MLQDVSHSSTVHGRGPETNTVVDNKWFTKSLHINYSPSVPESVVSIFPCNVEVFGFGFVMS